MIFRTFDVNLLFVLVVSLRTCPLPSVSMRRVWKPCLHAISRDSITLDGSVISSLFHGFLVLPHLLLFLILAWHNVYLGSISGLVAFGEIVGGPRSSNGLWKCDRAVLVLHEYMVDSADVSWRADDKGKVYWGHGRVIVYDSRFEYLNGRQGSSPCIISGD